MIDAFDWYPKPFSPGDMEGKGSLKLLGKPSLPLVAVLVRETAQNSWDARVSDQQLDFHIQGRTLNNGALATLKQTLFTHGGNGTCLSVLLAMNTMDVLEVSDRGAGGLGGPVRNDRVYEEGVTTDYVDFVLNIGAKQDKAMGGGTYGYGKTICYLASQARTIVIWTKTIVDGKIESRLIASAFGDQFDLDDRRYTGRQWWGRLNDEVIEPLLGTEADVLGAALFDRTFDEGETGTSILILQPNFASNLDELMSQISTAVLWHLWPKLTPSTDGSQPMKITLKHHGEELRLPDPERHDFLRGYVQSLNAIRDVQAGKGKPEGLTTCDVILMRSPKVTLGNLAISKAPCLNPEDSKDPMVPVSGVSSHIALMRHEAELVVTYLSQPNPPLDALHFCGVFKPEFAVDPIFAQAEPPAHDAWEPAGMTDPKEKQHVNVALREMRKVWTQRARPEQTSVNSDANIALGALSTQLSDLVPSLAGTRAGPAPITASRIKKKRKKRTSCSNNGSLGVPSNGVPARRQNRIVIGESGVDTSENGTGLAYVQFDVEGEINALRITAGIGVGYDGGTDSDAASEYVYGVHYLSGHHSAEWSIALREPVFVGPVIDLLSPKEKQWTLVVEFDKSVALDLTLKSRQIKVS